MPNPDPAADSATSAFISESAPYMVPTYVRPAPMMIKGQGCYLWDMENRRYLDLTAGIAVNGLGHCDPEIAQVISEQVCLITFARVAAIFLLTDEFTRVKSLSIPPTCTTMLGRVPSASS